MKPRIAIRQRSMNMCRAQMFCKESSLEAWHTLRSTRPCLQVGRTLERTEASRHDQFQVAKLPLAQDDGRELFGLSAELIVASCIAGKQVLQDPTVGRIGHVLREERQVGTTKPPNARAVGGMKNEVAKGARSASRPDYIRRPSRVCTG